MTEKLEETLNTIFFNVQFNKTSHTSYLKKLKKCYDRNDFNTFWDCFISCLKIPLSISQRHPHVENTLDFVAKFAVSFCSFADSETSLPMCSFLTELFNFLLSHHNAKDPAVRFRICHFLNLLLNSMGDQAFIDDTLCDKITVNMMERLLDRSPRVRAQAVIALYRLQDPSDEQCPVIKMYIFHLNKDPNPEVRRAVLSTMGKNQRTLQAAIKKTRDVNEKVRKMAYEFISKITVRSLTIKQRDQLLSDGLKDRSELVRKCVQNILLPSWLNYFKGDYISLLKAFDAEIGTETSILALQTLFKAADVATVLKQVPIDEETKLIPVEKLTSENVLYWFCVVQFLHRESCVEKMETVLPELSKFCTYIKSYIAFITSKQYGNSEMQAQQFILLQLFEISKIYDLSDEVGRKNLNELIVHTLLSDCCSVKIIESIVEHMETVVPDVNIRLDTLVNVVNEIRMPSNERDVLQISPEEQHERDMKKARLKVQLLEFTEEEYLAVQKKDYMQAEALKVKINSINSEIAKLSEQSDTMVIEEAQEEKTDPETLIKCFGIMCTMMQSKSITVLTPTLGTLLQTAFESLDHPNDSVCIMALKAVGIACLLDKELAKKYIMIFFLQLSLEHGNQEAWVMSLKAIFDILLLYGLEYFDMTPNLDQDSTCNRLEKSRTVKLYSDAERDHSVTLSSVRSDCESKNGHLVKILTGYIDNANQELRTVATEGLCKLLLHQRISGSSFLSRLIILCFNPVNDGDTYLRQCLSNFFDHYAIRVPDGQETLERAFLPTLRILSNAPDISPLQEIDPYHVAKFILSLTRIGVKRNGQELYCAHNNLAFTILAEVLNPESTIDQEALIKCLKDLDIQIDDSVAKANLLKATLKVLEMVNQSEKRLIKYIEQFKSRLETPGAVVEMAEESTENEDEASDDNV